MRKWAIDNGLVLLKEQLITEERINKVRKYLSPENMLSLVLRIVKEPETNQLYYVEQILIPFSTIIKKNWGIQITGWEADPQMWDKDHNILGFWNFHLFFWLLDLDEELATYTHSRVLAKTFSEYSLHLPAEFEKSSDEDGAIQVNSYGDLKALFFKNGRAYDVKLQHTPGSGRQKYEKKVKETADKIIKQIEKLKNKDKL